MPSKTTIERARTDKRRGKAPSTQAGEFVREEVRHVRQGKHGARSPKQAIAIGLSKARRAGVDLPPPKKGKTSERTRKSAERAYEVGQGTRSARAPSKRRGRATTKALQREGRSAASPRAMSSQARSSARKRTAADRSAAARRGAQSRTPAQRSASAKKAAATRKRRMRASA